MRLVKCYGTYFNLDSAERFEVIGGHVSAWFPGPTGAIRLPEPLAAEIRMAMGEAVDATPPASPDGPTVRKLGEK